MIDTKTDRDKVPGPLLEYEMQLVRDLSEGKPIADQLAEKALPSQCYSIVARGFSVPKLVACLMYERYSCPQERVVRTCSPYLIFILNFDEVDYKALEVNMQWLEAHDRRQASSKTKRQPITITMLQPKDLTKRGDLYLKGKFTLDF